MRILSGFRWESAQGLREQVDIRSIDLDLRSEDDIFETVSREVNIYFRLVTADTCLKKIDDIIVLRSAGVTPGARRRWLRPGWGAGSCC